MFHGIQRRTAYVGTAIAILALVVGFTLAVSSVLLSAHDQDGLGENTAATGGVNGISFVGAILNVTPSPDHMTIQVGLGGPSAPVAAVPGLNVFCMSGGPTARGAPCEFGDFSEWENYSFMTGFTGTIEITMYVGTSGGGAVQSLYLRQATPAPTSGNILLLWDLGTQPQSVSSLTVTLYQCNGATSCP